MAVRRNKNFILRASGTLGRALLYFIVGSILWVVVYKFVPPPITLTMMGDVLSGHSLHKDWMSLSAMDPDMAREGLESLATLANLNADAEDIRPSRLAVSSLEMGWYMGNQLLRDADWAGMAHSLEIRVPFVDLDLLSAAAPWLAAHPGITKAEVAAVVAPNLPSRVLSRPKTGFTVPVREWIRPTGAAQNKRGLRGWAEYVHNTFSAPVRGAAL